MHGTKAGEVDASRGMGREAVLGESVGEGLGSGFMALSGLPAGRR